MRTSLSGRVGRMIPVSVSTFAVHSRLVIWSRMSIAGGKLRRSRKSYPARQLPTIDQRVDVRSAARIEVDVALADARLLGEQPGRQQRLADLLGEGPLVAGEALGQVGELGVVAAPLAHAPQPLQDPPRRAQRRIGVVVGPRDVLAELLDRVLIGGPTAKARDTLGHEEARVDRCAEVL